MTKRKNKFPISRGGFFIKMYGLFWPKGWPLQFSYLRIHQLVCAHPYNIYPSILWPLQSTKTMHNKIQNLLKKMYFFFNKHRMSFCQTICLINADSRGLSTKHLLLLPQPFVIGFVLSFSLLTSFPPYIGLQWPSSLPPELSICTHRPSRVWQSWQSTISPLCCQPNIESN